MYGYIYKTTNLLNNLIYIGQKHADHFIPTYLGSGKLIKRAVKKDGAANFKVELLEEINSAELMDAREIYWIYFYHATDHSIGYNISEGGNVNRTMVGANNPFYHKKHSLETIDKIKKANIGKTPWNKGLTKETDIRVKQYSISNKRGQFAKNTVWINNTISTKMVKQENLQDYLDNGWTVGRLKISSDKYRLATLGTIRINNGKEEKRILPEELDTYLANGWDKGRKKFKSTENYGKHIMKSVICLELNKNYPSVKIAGEELSIAPGAISACCKGKRQTAGGFHWKYLENN